MIRRTSICFEHGDKQTNKQINKKNTRSYTLIQKWILSWQKKTHTMKQILGRDEIVRKILKFYLVVLTTLHHVRSGNINFIRIWFSLLLFFSSSYVCVCCWAPVFGPMLLHFFLSIFLIILSYLRNCIFLFSSRVVLVYMYLFLVQVDTVESVCIFHILGIYSRKIQFIPSVVAVCP